MHIYPKMKCALRSTKKHQFKYEIYKQRNTRSERKKNDKRIIKTRKQLIVCRFNVAASEMPVSVCNMYACLTLLK